MWEYFNKNHVGLIINKTANRKLLYLNKQMARIRKTNKVKGGTGKVGGGTGEEITGTT